jgi:hypothetical protein
MKPIRVYQCKGDCCLVQVPRRRFWYIDAVGVKSSHTSFREAIALAQQIALRLPQEVTA